MDTIQTITDAAQHLTPNEIRDRLADLDREGRMLRALLRAMIRAGVDAASNDDQEGAQ